ncbi:MAG: glycosyltransferase [Candidatus Staskawiczbacteria bacterium]|jgi:glycosyltransferase involved in cell wall biosynthesis
MKRPFFSVIIPTKNRPELLRDAISSVLLQNFDDYELIVSDNFNDDRTKKIVEEFRDNEHLNYIKTDREMNMPDHWEFATQKASGFYVMVLTDRSFLRQGSLCDIYDSISKAKEEVDICFWDFGLYDEKRKILFGEKEKRGVEFLKSKDLIENFSKTLGEHFLPRLHSSCYRFDIAEKIRQNVGRLCWPISPDYTSALLLLAHSDSVLYIPRSLFFFQGEVVSNGTNAKFNPAIFISSLSVENPYQFVPIKVPIIYSTIINDLLTIKNMVKGNFGDINIDWVFYFTTCYVEVMGNLTRPDADKKAQLEHLKEWKKTLLTFDKKFQRAVWRAIRRRYKEIIKSYIRSSFAGNFLAGVKRFLLGKPTRKCLGALDAGGFDYKISKK